MEEVKIEAVKAEKKDPISDANTAADRLEKANAELKSLLQQKETLMVQERLGGRGDYIREPVKKSEEEEAKETLTAIYKRVGLNPFK